MKSTEVQTSPMLASGANC